MSEGDVQLVLDGLIEVLKEATHDKGDSVTIKNLGTFKLKKVLPGISSTVDKSTKSIVFVSLMAGDD